MVTQNKGARIEFEAERGYAAVYESLDGIGLGTRVVLQPSRLLRSVKLPADKEGKNAHAILITRPDADGHVIYRAGFAWAADGEITTPQAWFDYLSGSASR